MKKEDWVHVWLISIVVGIIFFTASRCAKGNDAAILAACPLEGDAKQAEARALNPLKRRTSIPTEKDIDGKVTLAAMLAQGDDTKRWNDSHAARIEGYVAGVKVGGVESVNCHTRQALYRDTHIALSLEPSDYDESHYVIVEVTPQLRAQMKSQNIIWTTTELHKLVGHKVRVTGWLLFDAEHKQNALNTAPHGEHLWRATVWEIHPVTAIEDLTGQ